MALDTALVFGFLFGVLVHVEYRIDKIYQILRSGK